MAYSRPVTDGSRKAIFAAFFANLGSAISKFVEMKSQLIHILTEHIGPDEILVGAKIQFASSLSADQLLTAINATEDSIRAAVPVPGATAATATTAPVIYLEPDIHRTDHPDLIAQADPPGEH